MAAVRNGKGRFNDSLRLPTGRLCSTPRIEIRGFGSFAVGQYGAYEGRNPKTGEVVNVAPKRLPHFKVGKELKDLVNKQGME